MTKNIICIIGTSTAGKTSLLELLSNKDLFEDNVTILPQTTCREQRVDDEPRFTELVTKEEFKSRNFLVGDKVYATDQHEFMSFIDNGKDNDILVMIVGTNNIEPLERIVDTNFPNCKLHNICLRLGGKNKEQEKVILEKNLQNFFKPNEQDRVKKTQHQLIENFFFNDKFLKKNNFLILNKNELKLNEYVEKMQEQNGLKLTNRLKTLKIISDRIVKENNKKRLGNATGQLFYDK